jgi:glycosyltransferase involved in cell wall biosynthesis
MFRRGHEIVLAVRPDGALDFHLLAGCDVVHVYRRHDQATQDAVALLAQSGPAITFDNDDDHESLPRESPAYETLDGRVGRHKRFADSVKMARCADRCITPSDALAAKYRQSGVERVEVIENYLDTDLADLNVDTNTGVVTGLAVPDQPFRRSAVSHDGVVVGWIAGLEHYADAARLDIAGALRRLIACHDQVRVECIGVDLSLPERYRHDPKVPFADLPRRIAEFDIAIAPLADIPWNHSRSNIKLKEYAACGVPWLASPVGPYPGLGEEQGGRLVPDNAWFEALERLVNHPDERAALAHNAQAWANSQTVDVAADRWERMFTEVATETRAR